MMDYKKKYEELSKKVVEYFWADTEYDDAREIEFDDVEFVEEKRVECFEACDNLYNLVENDWNAFLDIKYPTEEK